VEKAGTSAVNRLTALRDAEQAGHPFLAYRDSEGRQRVVSMDGRADRMLVGRRSSCDIALIWDDEVSRVHAQLECVGGDWVLVDGGMSSNGSLVNGEPIRGRRRLVDRDVLRFGLTAVVYRDPRHHDERETRRSSGAKSVQTLTPAQRRVLVALCRPYASGGAFAVPATNRAIAEELFITVDAVKKHLRTLFERYGIRGLPHNAKRAKLAERALAGGLIAEDEL
jgi:pSer/pThr/pTyr-binding forkhead associated (FHA) protein